MLNWEQVERDLEQNGYARTGQVLDPVACRELIALYPEDHRFRSRIVMERFRFGSGEYKYFAYPLPEKVQELRSRLYPGLAKIATQWDELLGDSGSRMYPKTLQQYLSECHAKGQTKPTALLLKYGPGGYNCLHQDLYGEMVFPLQCTLFLSATSEYKGGEFLLVEQRPRAQSRGEAILCEQGEMLVFPVRHRPVRGGRGYYRTTMRHGVSTIREGDRYTLGIIFHDAK